jgi:hypothetical protein
MPREGGKRKRRGKCLMGAHVMMARLVSNRQARPGQAMQHESNVN